MITQLETAFNITVDNDKAVSNSTGEPTLVLSSTLANRQLTISNSADLNVSRRPTRPRAL